MIHFAVALFADYDPGKAALERAQTFQSIGMVLTVVAAVVVLVALSWAMSRDRSSLKARGWAGDGFD